MSRVGKQTIEIPPDVELDTEGQTVKVKGPQGKLEYKLPHQQLHFIKEGGRVTVGRGSDSKKVRSLHGLSRSLIKNMIIGVKQGYEKRLEIRGVGFRAQKKGKTLELKLGFSHPVKYPIPEDINIKVEDATKMIISGIDKAKVGDVAAEIRDLYKPEPYKGKGIRYEGEQVRRKAGKTIA